MVRAPRETISRLVAQGILAAVADAGADARALAAELGLDAALSAAAGGPGASDLFEAHRAFFRAPLIFDPALEADGFSFDAPARAPAGALERGHERLLRRTAAGTPRAPRPHRRGRRGGRERVGRRGTRGGERRALRRRALGAAHRPAAGALRAEPPAAPSEAGASFRRIVDDLRRERAQALLAEPRFSLGEIGFLLGFADLSAFSRACKRWFGRAPRELRAEAAAARAPGARA